MEQTGGAEPIDIPSAARYIGGELELFARAVNWKNYVRTRLAPHLGTNVLEVGAGIGTTTRFLAPGVPRWTCLEPDAVLAESLRSTLQSAQLSGTCTVRLGTTCDLAGEAFDTVLYVDVLEHIADDRVEMQRAADLLVPGGRIVVLAPAHQWLFSPFDEAIGHFRRYTKAALKQLTPPATRQIRAEYSDSIGLLASAANRCLLRQRQPGEGQIGFWDRVMVPLSRIVDPLLGRAAGKTVIVVWEMLPPTAG